MPRKPAPRRPGKPPWKPTAKLRGGKPARPMGGQRRRPKPPVRAVEGDESESAAPQRDGDRLQKVLAAAGIASRRECEELITEGRVEVDGQVVSELGARVDRTRQEIRVDGEPLPRPKLVYFAVNKPTGVVTTARDPAGRQRVIDLLPPSVGRVFTVGRLDLESEGLILLTNDGELANQLTHPKHGVEKTYLVQVAGHMEPDVLAQLRRGVHLSEGYAHAVNARIKTKLKKSTMLEMVLDEGRNREVRRLLARVGHKVQRLTRIAVGPIRLGEMPRGAHRKLTQEEVRQLHEAAAAGSKPTRAAEGDRRPPRQFAKKPRPRKPLAGKAPLRKPRIGGSRPTAAGAPREFQRKIVGAPAVEGEPAGDRPLGGKPTGGRPHGGKPKFRKSVGTKTVGPKPFKRRRPERPQRGGN